MGKPTLIGFWASAASGAAKVRASSMVRKRSSMECLLDLGWGPGLSPAHPRRSSGQKTGRPGTCTRMRYTEVDAVM